jgi:hypothetical protein
MQFYTSNDNFNIANKLGFQPSLLIFIICCSFGQSSYDAISSRPDIFSFKNISGYYKFGNEEYNLESLIL